MIEAPAGFEWGQERGVPIFELQLAPCSSMERTRSVCPRSIRSAISFGVRCAARSTRSWCSIACKDLVLRANSPSYQKSRAPERVAVSDVFLICRGGRVFDTGCSLSDPPTAAIR
jgi:hypothetical protein